ncbi:hypothetical protein GCM10010174_35270 [Kutzneria viridogrisea]|uniref:Membrane protein n=2 Tax=Kutzneria TaxID=43356 RepID=A0ABR6BLI7_9PSEU|nr:vitamin K epoxide reductase family protein [Kutzneria albida]AHH94930.1 putative membrane protein [Kutzneria albida DSM 43870]MBA8927738.1 putative membrane protein [Kutzneria viridogrisea]
MAAGTETVTSSQPKWLTYGTLVLSLAGLAVAIYMTISHYTDDATLICSVNAMIDCAAVTNSPEAVIFGIPVAVLGLVFFVPMVVLTSPWAWRAELPALRWMRLGGVVVGLLFVVYLVTVELAIIGKICEWCTGVHVITLALFALILTAELRTRPA